MHPWTSTKVAQRKELSSGAKKCKDPLGNFKLAKNFQQDFSQNSDNEAVLDKANHFFQHHIIVFKSHCLICDITQIIKTHC